MTGTERRPCRRCGKPITRSKQARFCTEECSQASRVRKKPMLRCSFESADKIVRLLLEDPGACAVFVDRFGDWGIGSPAPAPPGKTYQEVHLVP